MVRNQKVYSKEEIDMFMELSKKYYGINGEGYFFDCGCNILTTTIYALRKYELLKAVAFEPCKETYKMAYINTLINNMNDRISLVNTALSNKNSDVYIEKHEGNCGGNNIISTFGKNIEKMEKCETTTLDNWCNKQNFEIDKINYLWIDAEGYEGYIIDGAKKVLSKKDKALYLEYEVRLLKRAGCYELLLENLSKLYTGFIIVEMGGKISNVKSIKELDKINKENVNLFMIT